MLAQPQAVANRILDFIATALRTSPSTHRDVPRQPRP